MTAEVRGGRRHARRGLFPKGKRWWVRLHEKGGKRHEMPAQPLVGPNRQISLAFSPRRSKGRDVPKGALTPRAVG